MSSENVHKIINAQPAPYPTTAAAEQDSKNIFQSLLDTRFVRGELRTMDKYPNTDGILEITDIDRILIGKIEVQLKTLQPKHYATPCYQCDRSFLAACESSALPVFLVVVDRQNRKAYWKHMDREALLMAAQNLQGVSVSVAIDSTNCIDGSNTEYINQWTQKAKEATEKVWNYDSLQKQKLQLQTECEILGKRLKNPVNLPLPILKEIYSFLDCYNYILDREFSSIKQVLYPDFWKIGFGILGYDSQCIRFVLFPVKFQDDQRLVKEVDDAEREDLLLNMSRGNILLIAGLTIGDNVERSQPAYAYDVVANSILRIAGKYNFPIANKFIAHEYLVSFVDRYSVYLDIDKSDSYSLTELRYKLHSVLPMLEGTKEGFADWVRDYSCNIDSYSHWKKPAPFHQKAVAKSIQQIKEGIVPKVNVTITSEAYNIELIHFYINWLEKTGESHIHGVYADGQFDEKMYGVDFWKTWNKEILWENVQIFFRHFYDIYAHYITEHFPLLVHYLQIIPSQEVSIVCLYLPDSKPSLEMYFLRPVRPRKKGRVLCYNANDANNPIDRKAFFLRHQWNCKIEEDEFWITEMHAQPLEFMFESSPTYALMNMKLSQGLQHYFWNKKREKTTITN